MHSSLNAAQTCEPGCSSPALASKQWLISPSLSSSVSTCTWRSVALKAELSGRYVAGSSGCILVVFQSKYCNLNVTRWIFQQGSPLDSGARGSYTLPCMCKRTRRSHSWFLNHQSCLITSNRRSIHLTACVLCLQIYLEAGVHTHRKDKCGENEGEARAKLNYPAKTITVMISIYTAHSNGKRLEGKHGVALRSSLLSVLCQRDFLAAAGSFYAEIFLNQ